MQNWSVYSLDLIGISKKLHFKKVEELFCKVLFVDERLKCEMSLESVENIRTNSHLWSILTHFNETDKIQTIQRNYIEAQRQVNVFSVT